MCRILIIEIKFYLVFKGVKKMLILIPPKNKLIMVEEKGLLKAYINY